MKRLILFIFLLPLFLFGQDVVERPPIFYLPMGANWVVQTNKSQDISGNANHATNYGVTSAADRFGRLNEAYTFDGVDDSIKPASLISFADNKAYSISFWVKTSNNVAPTYGVFSNTAINKSSFLLYSASQLHFYPESGSSVVWSFNQTISTWYNIILTCDGAATAKINCYVNRVNLGFQMILNSEINIQVIGNYGNGGGDLLGTLSDFRVYDYALTSGQVTSLYNKTRGFDIADPLSTNLEVYYPFGSEFAQGAISQDISGNQNHSTNYGVTSTTNRFGELNTAYSFDGTNDSIKPNELIVLNYDELWTLSVYYYNAASVGSYSSLWGYNYTTGKNGRFWWTGSTFQFGIDAGGTQSWTYSISQNTWYHLVLTNDGAGNVTLYVNGVNQSTKVIGSFTHTIQVLGNAGKGNYDLNGRLDDFKIWNKALTAGQVSRLYNETRGFDIADYPAFVYTDQSVIDQNAFIFRLPVGKTIYLDWGNGTIEAVNGLGAVDITKTSNYTITNDSYKISISGDIKSVTKFSISTGAGNNLFGDLQISKFTSLTFLYLSTLPNCTIEAGEIGSLTSLTTLYLLAIPNCTIGAGEIGSLTSLTFLYLSTIPNCTIGAGEIGSLTSLTYLSLITIPNCTIGAGEIGSLTSLTTLYLSAIPNCTIGAGEIGSLTSLTTLYLSTIPNCTIGAGEIGSLTSLTYLSLITIPNCTIGAGEIGSLTSLTTLYLSAIPNCTIGAGEFRTAYTTLYITGIASCAVAAGENFPNKNITITNSNMTTTSMDNMLIRLDALGYIGKTLVAAGNNQPHTNPGAAETARLSLNAKGWTTTSVN